MRNRRNAWISAAFEILAFIVALPCCAAVQKKLGRLEPVRESAELKANLAKYGLKAGRFVRSEPLPVEGGRIVPQELQYLVFKPVRGRSPKVPLVVYLPGVGEIGDSLDKQFHEPAVFKAVTSEPFQKRHPCYLLALTPPLSASTLMDGLPGEPSPVQTLLADAIKEVATAQKAPSVDMGRIYLTGLSYGGGGVYGLMTSFPDTFAAGVPVATFPPPPSFVTCPIRVWHIYNDGDYAKAGLDRTMLNPFADAVSNAGGTFKVGTFPSEGHNAWAAAWGEDSVWDWTFGQSLAGNGRRSRTASGKMPEKAGVSMTAHSDVAAASGHEAFRSVDGLDGTWFESDGPARKGVVLTVDFNAPVKNRIVILRHGDGSATSSPPLLVEASRNGKSWMRIGVMPAKADEWAFRPPSAIRGLRLSLKEDSDVPLRIREIRAVDR